MEFLSANVITLSTTVAGEPTEPTTYRSIPNTYSYPQIDVLSLLIKEASLCRRWTLLQKALTGQNAENVYLGPQPHLIHLCHSPYMYDSGNIKDKGGVKISMPQRTEMSALRFYLLYMTWKLQPWNLNNMVAQQNLSNNTNSWHANRNGGDLKCPTPRSYQSSVTAEMERTSFPQVWFPKMVIQYHWSALKYIHMSNVIWI